MSTKNIIKIDAEAIVTAMTVGFHSALEMMDDTRPDNIEISPSVELADNLGDEIASILVKYPQFVCAAVLSNYLSQVIAQANEMMGEEMKVSYDPEIARQETGQHSDTTH